MGPDFANSYSSYERVRNAIAKGHLIMRSVCLADFKDLFFGQLRKWMVAAARHGGFAAFGDHVVGVCLSITQPEVCRVAA